MNLTIEQMRKIVDGAPDRTASHYVGDTDTYFSEEFHTYFCHTLKDWETSDFHCASDLEMNYEVVIDLKDLRAALADHNRTDHVTDIRNHVSPNTRVSEVHVNEAFKLK